VAFSFYVHVIRHVFSYPLGPWTFLPGGATDSKFRSQEIANNSLGKAQSILDQWHPFACDYNFPETTKLKKGWHWSAAMDRASLPSDLLTSSEWDSLFILNCRGELSFPKSPDSGP